MSMEKEQLMGKTGQITKEFTVIDVQENQFGTDIRVKEEDGEVYWTSLNQSIDLD